MGVLKRPKGAGSLAGFGVPYLTLWDKVCAGKACVWSCRAERRRLVAPEGSLGWLTALTWVSDTEVTE